MSIIGVTEWGTPSDKTRYPTLRDFFDSLVEGDGINLLENFGAGMPLDYQGDKVYVFDKHGPVSGLESLFVTNALCDILSTNKAKIFNPINFQFYNGMKIIIGVGDPSNSGIYEITAVDDKIFAVYISSVVESGTIDLDNSDPAKPSYVKIAIDNYDKIYNGSSFSGSLVIDCSANSPVPATLATIAHRISLKLEYIHPDLKDICFVDGDRLRINGVDTSGNGKIKFETPAGEVDDVSATTTKFKTDLTGYGDGYLENMYIIIDTQKVKITDYTSLTGELTVTPALISAPANGTYFEFAGNATEVLFGITVKSFPQLLAPYVNDASATTSVFKTSLTGYGDDYFNGLDIVINTQQVQITDYVSLTGELTVTPALSASPINGTDFVFIGSAGTTDLPKTITSELVATLDREMSAALNGQKAYVLYPRLLEVNDVAAIRENLRNTVSLARTKYAGRDFNTYVDEALSYLRFYYGDKFNNFYASDYGIMLIEAMAFMLDTMSFYLSFKAGENYFDTLRLDASAAKIARQNGYKAKGAVAAVANITIGITRLSSTPVSFYIGKGSVFSFGGKVFSLANDVFVDGRSWTTPSVALEAVCFEGELLSLDKVGTGNANQKINIIVTEGKFLASNYPGETDPNGVKLIETLVAGSEYAYVEFLSFDESLQDAFEIEFNNDPPYILFGDGVAGTIPPDGALINVEYAITSGLDGNASIESEVTGFDSIIVKNTGRDVASDDYRTDVYSGYSIDNIVITATSPATGGANPETVDEIKVNAPASFATARRAVTPDDYVYFISRYSSSIKGAAIPNHGLEDNGEIEQQINNVFGSMQTALLNVSGLSESQKTKIIDALNSGELSMMNGLSPIVSEDGKVNHVLVYIVALASDGSYISPADATLDGLKAYLTTKKMVTTSLTVRDGIEFVISVDALIGIKVKPFYNTDEVRSKAEDEVRTLMKGKNFGDDLFLSVCEEKVQSVAGTKYCHIDLIPFRTTKLGGVGNLNDPNDNVINGDGSWYDVYAGGSKGFKLSSDMVDFVEVICVGMAGYGDGFWNGCKITVVETGDIGIVEEYSSFGGVFTVYGFTGGPYLISDRYTFLLSKQYNFMRIKNTLNSGFYEIGAVRKILSDLEKTEVELGVSTSVIAVGTEPKRILYTGLGALGYNNDFWNSAKLKFTPVYGSVSRKNGGPEYRVIDTYNAALGTVILPSGNQLIIDSASTDGIFVSTVLSKRQFLGHILQYPSEGINMECVLGGVVDVSERLGALGNATNSTTIVFVGSTKPKDWYVDGDYLFIKHTDASGNYGIYRIDSVEADTPNAGDTTIILVDDLLGSSGGSIYVSVCYLRMHDTDALKVAKLEGYGAVDDLNTDEVKGNPDWFAFYNENLPEDILIPVDGLGVALYNDLPVKKYTFQGSANWKKIFDDRPIGQTFNVKVLADNGSVLSKIYRIRQDSLGNYMVYSHVASGTTYTRIEVDKMWNDLTSSWDDIGTQFSNQSNVAVSYHSFGYPYKLLITDGVNIGRYDVLSVTMKEGGGSTIVKLKNELIGLDADGSALSDMSCCFMRQSDEDKDGDGNVIAENPENSKFEIISMGSVSSYLITKET